MNYQNMDLNRRTEGGFGVVSTVGEQTMRHLRRTTNGSMSSEITLLTRQLLSYG